jgi:hypothetical protein
MAMKKAYRRLRTVGAEAGTGRHRGALSSFDLALRASFELKHRTTCPMDRAAYIFLIIHDTHPTHTVRREARGHILVVVFATKTTFYTILSIPRGSYGPNYPWKRVSLAESLRGQKSPKQCTLEFPIR